MAVVRSCSLALAAAAGLCSLASSSLNRPAEARAELVEAKAALDAVSDAQLADRIDVAGYVAQAAAALERIDVRAGMRCIAVSVWPRRRGRSPYIPGHARARDQRTVHEGPDQRGQAVAETATDAAVLTGNDQFAIWALWADAMVCSCAGDTARALASAREAVARSERVPATFFSSLSRLHLAAALHAGGDVAGAACRARRI